MREAVREHYDAVVGLLPAGDVPRAIFVAVKRTYDLRKGSLAPAVPLARDVWTETGPDRLVPGSDYWYGKPKTDVAVLGHAFLLPKAQQGEVFVRVGDAAVRAIVLGPRVVRWNRGGRPRFEEAEPVEKVPMTWELAYGGGDPRVPFPRPKTYTEQLRLMVDHPGVYPRNPYGKGYIVVDEAVDEIALPQIERPDDRLTPERFVTRDPALWHRQPRPIAFELRTPKMFPRRVFGGTEAWFPGPEDERLAEVKDGELPLRYRSEHGLAAGGGLKDLDARFLQEAIAPLQLENPQPGMPIEVRGMHPEGRVASFVVPEPPRVEIVLEGRVAEPPMRPTLIVVHPEEERVTITWGTSTTQMHRIFVPGIHATIPLAIRVDGDDPIPYDTPPTQRALLQAATAGEPK
jgi:hypothetical protein